MRLSCNPLSLLPAIFKKSKKAEFLYVQHSILCYRDMGLVCSYLRLMSIEKREVFGNRASEEYHSRST